MINNIQDTLGQVVTFRLTSGEEVVARVEDISNDKRLLIISEPAFIAHTQRGMQFAPGLFTVETKAPVTLNTSCVVMYGLTEDAIKMKYIEAVTGIQLPEKKIIMG